MSTDPLYSWLHNSPFEFGYEFPIPEQIKSQILKKCIDSFIGSDESIVPLLFNSSGIEAYFPDSEILTCSSNLNQQSSHICGHIFKKGEAIYRCKTCGLDDTCVMCVNCFNTSCHTGHNITFHLSINGGGCCDCGDDQVWKFDIGCKKHQKLDHAPNNITVPYPETIVSNIRSTITTICDFIVDTLSNCQSTQQPLPSAPALHDSIKPETPNEVDLLSKHSFKYVLVLWNDEHHSFNEVIYQVDRAINCGKETCKTIAERVDIHGRAIITIGTSIEELRAKCQIINQIELTTTISSARDAFREEIASMLISFLVKLFEHLNETAPDTSNQNHYESIRNVVRKIICETLFSPPTYPKKAYCKLNLPQPDIYLVQVQEEEWGEFIDYPTDISEEEDYSKFMNLSQTSRIEQLFRIDSRLWKELRNEFKDLLINTFIKEGDDAKKVLSTRFSSLYLELMYNYLFDDREYEHNILSFAVQLYTVPSSTNYLVQNTGIISTMCLILKTYFLVDAYKDSYDPSEFYHRYKDLKSQINQRYEPITCEYDNTDRSKPRKFDIIFQHLNYILTSPLVQKLTFRKVCLGRDFKHIIDMLRVWQGMNPQVRSAQQHVEYETESWVLAFTISTDIESVLNAIGLCFSPSDEFDHSNSLISLVLAIQMVIQSIINNRTPKVLDEQLNEIETVPGLSVKKYLVNEFVVSKESMSFHRPLHWLLCSLIEQVPKYISLGVVIEQSKFWESMFSFDSEVNIVDVMEDPLRTIVFVSQINAGMWVRNGLNIRNQGIHYREAALHNCYDRDQMLVQICANHIDPDLFLATLIHRFEVSDIFHFQNQNYPQDIDNHQKIQMVESMLRLIITVLSERSFACDIATKDQIEREIIHHLASSRQGLAYSELTKRVSDRLLENSNKNQESLLFDEILKQVAKFKYPEGISDRGLYILKPEYFSRVDPWFWHFTKNQKEEVEETLKSNQMKLEDTKQIEFWDLETVESRDYVKLDIPGIGIESGLRKLNELVVSDMFLHVVFYSLYNCVYLDSSKISNQNETILGQAFHLLSIALFILPEPFSRLATTQTLKCVSNDLEQSYDSCLLVLLLRMLEDQTDSLKSFKIKIKAIIKEMIQFEIPNSIYSEWKDNMLEKYKNDILSFHKEISEVERKKDAAKARRALLLSKIKADQQSFMENTNELESENLDTPMSPNDLADYIEFPSGSCIVCQEDACLKSSMYGIVSYVQPTILERRIDFSRTNDFIGVLNTPSSLDFDVNREPPVFEVTDESHQQIQPNPKNITGNPTIDSPMSRSSTEDFGLNATTCGHLIHFSCFEGYFSSVRQRQATQTTRNHPENLQFREYLCPLCKCLSNMLLPVHFDNTKKISLTPRESSICDDMIAEHITHPIQNTSMLSRSELLEVFTKKIETYVMQSLENISMDTPEIVMPGAFPSNLIKHIYKNYTTRFSESLQIANAFGFTYIDPTGMNIDRKRVGYALSRKVLCDTISCIEIASRGTKNCQETGTFLDSINHQNLTILRILSKNVSVYTYLSFQNSPSNVKERYEKEIHDIIEPFTETFNVKNIYYVDPFYSLVNWIYIIQPDPEKGVFCLIGLFWCVSVIRSILSLIENVLCIKNSWDKNDSFIESCECIPDISESEQKLIDRLFDWVIESLYMDETLSNRLIAYFHKTIKGKVAYRYIYATTLPYLRKCILLLYCRSGYIFEATQMNSLNEYDKLSNLFGLPTLTNLFEMILLNQTNLSILLNSWISRISSYEDFQPRVFNPDEEKTFPMINLSTPIIYEFIGLPLRIDTLLFQSIERTCKKCQLVPDNSAWCLICGDFLCCQSFCCSDMENGYGELNFHKRKCGAGVGVYFLNRRGAILLLHGNNKGVYMQPPFMDLHGEVDIGFQRGRPLFINKKRYDEIRKLWITHGIPSFIARKMEQIYDVGGWVTM